MIKVKFILSSVSRELLFWSVNQSSVKKKSELNVFRNIKFIGKTFNNWPNDLFGTSVYRTLKFCR